MPSKQHKQIVSELLMFIRTKVFWLNSLLALGGLVVLLWVISLLLGVYTRHGKSVSVPNLKGIKLEHVGEVLANSSFEYSIDDSTYNPDKPPLTVLDQTPEPGQDVKEGRIIYLTVNSRRAPNVRMPELRDNSLKQATLMLESYGLTLGQTSYKPDLAKDAVLDQLYHGQTIAAGTLVTKDAVIDLVLGDGTGQTTVAVPDLVGLTLTEAKAALQMASLSLGTITADASVNGDTLSAYVYKQYPVFGDINDTVKSRQAVNVFVTKNKKDN